MKNHLLRTLLAPLPLFLAACSGGGGGSDTAAGSTAPLDLSGEWKIEEQVFASECGEGTYDTSYSIQIAQSGSQLQVTTPAGTFAGSVDGSRLRWSGSYPEDGGTTSITSLSLDIQQSNGQAVSVSGNSKWNWSDGESQCSGTTNIVGTRTNVPTAGADVDVSGSWSIEETVSASECGEGTYQIEYEVEISQTGSSLSVATPAGTFSGTVEGTRIRWTGSYPDEGGTTTITSLVLDVAGSNGQAESLSGSSEWTWTDGSFTCSGTTQVVGQRITTSDGDGFGDAGSSDDGIDDGGSGDGLGGASVFVGTWNVTDDVASACSDLVDWGTHPVTVVEMGAKFSVTDLVGTFEGELDGDAITWTGAYGTVDGDELYKAYKLNALPDGSLAGSLEWLFVSADGSSCSGVDSATAVPATAALTLGWGADGGGLPAAAAAFHALGTSQATSTIVLTDASQRDVERLTFAATVEGEVLLHRALYLRDAAGNLTELVVEDADGEVLARSEHLRGPDGRLVEELFFAGPGADGVARTADDELASVLHHFPNGTQSHRIAPGVDGAWFTADDVVR